MRLETHYGKAEVSTYRTHGSPLVGLRRIPESGHVGRPNILLAASIDVQVMGEVFTEAYTEGDKVALNVGFYYMANAGGRLAGTVLSGLIFQLSGLEGCLWASVLFVAASAALCLPLPRHSQTLLPAVAGAGDGD